MAVGIRSLGMADTPVLSCLIHATGWANAPRWGEGRPPPHHPNICPNGGYTRACLRAPREARPNPAAPGRWPGAALRLVGLEWRGT
jgi:hypothetical protein